jgi:hypothetical protein
MHVAIYQQNIDQSFGATTKYEGLKHPAKKNGMENLSSFVWMVQNELYDIDEKDTFPTPFSND